MADAAMPFMLGQKTALAAAVRKLIKEGESEQAVIAVIGEASAGRFQTLATMFSMLSGIKEEGIRLLLKEPAHDSHAMSYVYAVSGLPERYFPLFAVIVDFTREVAARKGQAMGRKAQSFIVEKALGMKEIQHLNLSEQFVGRLRKSVMPIPEPDLGEAQKPLSLEPVNMGEQAPA